MKYQNWSICMWVSDNKGSSVGVYEERYNKSMTNNTIKFQFSTSTTQKFTIINSSGNDRTITVADAFTNNYN